MSDLIFEIRLCLSCGLRYPVEKNHQFSMRCPQCLGQTKVILQKIISDEEKTRSKAVKENKFIRAVLLDNIRSAWNVGSILRTADGLGYDQVYLCGITPTLENEALTKTSLGAEKSLDVSHHKNALELVKKRKDAGWKIFALEEDVRAVEIGKQVLVNTENYLLILGNEVTGVDSELLNLCDEIFYIPMYGEKRSFNVAIAFGVAAYALR